VIIQSGRENSGSKPKHGSLSIIITDSLLTGKFVHGNLSFGGSFRTSLNHCSEIKIKVCNNNTTTTMQFFSQNVPAPVFAPTPMSPTTGYSAAPEPQPNRFFHCSKEVKKFEVIRVSWFVGGRGSCLD